MKEQKPLRKGRKPAEGDKRQFLAPMDPGGIKAVKLAAIQDEISAPEILEETSVQWLAKRSKSRRDRISDVGLGIQRTVAPDRRPEDSLNGGYGSE